MWRGSFTLAIRKVRVAYFHTRTRESIAYFVFQSWRNHLLVLGNEHRQRVALIRVHGNC